MLNLSGSILYSDRASNRAVAVILCILLWGAAGGSVFSAHAQGGGDAADALTSQERPVRIIFRPTYQQFEQDDQAIRQWSAPLVAVVPFGESWQVSVRGSGASAGGDDLQTLSGLTDIRAALSYTQPVGDGSLILTANVNAPTGKEELTPEEFSTARLLSRNFYRFRVPGFGQGLGAGTGVTWAIPVSESVVIGIGGAFRYNGGYTPTAGQQAEYNPGEETRITGGLDVRLSPMSALSADATLYLYGTDTVGGAERFKAGNQVSARLQYLRRGDRHTVRIVAEYRNQEKSTLPLREGDDRALQVLPTRGTLRGQYTVGVAEEIDLQFSAAGRWYGETTAYESQTLVTIGLAPRFSIGEAFTIAPEAAYTAGTIMGLEGGVGLTAQF